MMTEKSPLPAIIVTPSSPSGETDYSIAFLAPPVKPSLRERVRASFSSPLSATFESLPTPQHHLRKSARIFFVLAIIMFVLVAHLVTHRLALRRPHLEFRVMTSDNHDAALHDTYGGSWFGFRDVWDGAPPTDNTATKGSVIDDARSLDTKATFIVVEAPPIVANPSTDIVRD